MKNGRRMNTCGLGHRIHCMNRQFLHLRVLYIILSIYLKTCFPTNNSTDVHHCDIVSSRSSPSHFTKDTPFNTSQVRTRSTTKTLNHCMENRKGYYLRNRNTGQATVWKMMQDLSWKMLIQLRHPLWLK
jgi:hypothetical protein